MEQPAGTGFVGLGPELAQPCESARGRLQSPSARYFGDDDGPTEPLRAGLPGGGVPRQAAPDVAQVPAQGYFQTVPFGYPLPMPPSTQGTPNPAAASFVSAPGTGAAPAPAPTLPVRTGLQVQPEERRRPPREQLQAPPAAAQRAPARKPVGRPSPAAVGAGAPAPAALEGSGDKFTGPSAVFVDLSGLVPRGQGQGGWQQQHAEEQRVQAG